MGRHSPRRGVGEDHRRLGHPDGVDHGVLGHVAEVDHHAQAIHLLDHLLAEGVQPVPFGRVGAAVGPGRALGVGQRHVARARIIEFAQQTQGVVDRIAAFHADQAGDLARAMDADQVVCGGGEFEGFGVGGDDALDRIDLFEGGLGRVDRRHAGGNVDRPELAAHAACAQTRDIGMQARRGR
ncbi:hypothetical protein D3C73_1026370 [compost metagenome]